MIPRLPPVILALLGGASIYGIKYVLDKLEPKALGPPGSSAAAEQQMDRVLNYRRNVKRVGIAAAASGVIYAGYYMYELRQHRASPAIMMTENDRNEQKAFYEDQYREREKRFARERAEMKRLERERELSRKEQLDKEVSAMENMIKHESAS
ncbi:MAG: hypothetical protein EXX96DRAFT_547788 [Benjaminiella poitrasii]|nr:MAG: hypothetical protein EXX96DRAFT_547788 [Benjaminiella poitrasii]